MAKINVRAKGATNERTLAQIFTQWAGVEFKRTPGSGAIQWKNRTNVCGDIQCTTPDFNFPFVIETKSWARMPKKLDNVSVLNAIDQAKKDAIKLNKSPLVFVRLNGMPAKTWLLISDFKLPLLEPKDMNNGIYVYESAHLFNLNYKLFADEFC